MSALYQFYSFYALALFALLLAPALVLYVLIKLFIPYRNQIKWVYRVNQAVVFIWSILVGMRYVCTGKELVNSKKAQIVIFNHYSLLDMFAINRHFMIAGKPLIKKELLSIPILGWLFKLTAIPIDRKLKESKQIGFKSMKEELAKGISILIFPEGTRNRTNHPLSNFKDGAFKLAIESQTSIQPAVIMNTKKMAKPNSWFFKPGVIHIQYLPAVHPEEFNYEIGPFTRKCYQLMETAILAFESMNGTNLQE
jgi:1-acyl-sn-glycerol-3-phosphate acyltransferase